MDLKEFLLEGGSIIFPFREKGEDWVGEAKIEVSLGKQSLPEVIVDTTMNFLKFSLEKIDEAIEYYEKHVFCEKNMWYKLAPALRDFNLREDWVSLDDKADYERIERKRRGLLCLIRG